jgi:hypothetical protein
MPTTIDSAGITFNDTTSLTSANIGTAQLVNGSVTAAKLGTTEQTQIAKAWVNFNGTTSPGTIRSSYNVSSVTKNGTGDYTVNFATAMADANYSVSAAASNLGSAVTAATRIGLFSTSNFTMYSTGFDTTKTNFNALCVTIFGN